MTEQKTARALEGFVVKTGRDKTITVRVDRTKLHAQYGKVIRPYSSSRGRIMHFLCAVSGRRTKNDTDAVYS